MLLRRLTKSKERVMLQNLLSWSVRFKDRSSHPSFLDGVLLLELGLHLTRWILFGSSSACLISFINLNGFSRRMMMTSGGTVHYKSMFDAGSQVCVVVSDARVFFY